MAGEIFSGEGVVESASLHWRSYLQRNVLAAETLRGMDDAIRVFRSYSPRLLVSKCIDGRVHGSDTKGYPPTTVTFSRTDGNRVELNGENSHFWNRVNGVMLAARRQTPGCPALFIALGHFGTLGRGCAAHGGDTSAALATVAEQATELRKRFRSSDLYVLHGLTNTDDGAESIRFADGRVLDTAAIIDTLNTPAYPLDRPERVFQDQFLDQPFDDPATDRSVGSRILRDLFELGLVMDDLRTRIALQDYLLREVTQIVLNQSRNNVVFDPRVFDEIRRTIDCVRDLPVTLKAPLLYQTLWNVMWTLQSRSRLPDLGTAQRLRWLEHGEDKVAYGDGFEIEERNRLVLAKPGRGDDRKALDVARRVLLNNRQAIRQSHPPLVHVNLEVAGEVGDWEAFNHDVLAQLQTRIDNVKEVFGDDCRILVTYSRYREKCFYPIQVGLNSRGNNHDDGDPRLSFPIDVTRGLEDSSFNREHLMIREQVYRQMMLLAADDSDSEGIDA